MNRDTLTHWQAATNAAQALRPLTLDALAHRLGSAAQTPQTFSAAERAGLMLVAAERLKSLQPLASAARQYAREASA